MPSEDIQIRNKPPFCRAIEAASRTKPSCADCDAFCAFTIDDILSESHGISQNDIILELKAHKHPSCRKMLNGKQRNTREAARELADHYIFSHNIQEEK